VRNCPIVNSMLYHLPERTTSCHSVSRVLSSRALLSRRRAGITLLDCGFTQITEEALEYLPLSLKALSIDNMAITGTVIASCVMHSATSAIPTHDKPVRQWFQ
jgi:hypothetical protein